MSTNEENARIGIVKSWEATVIFIDKESHYCIEHPWECKDVDRDIEEDPWPSKGDCLYRFF